MPGTTSIGQLCSTVTSASISSRLSPKRRHGRRRLMVALRHATLPAQSASTGGRAAKRRGLLAKSEAASPPKCRSSARAKTSRPLSASTSSRGRIRRPRRPQATQATVAARARPRTSRTRERACTTASGTWAPGRCLTLATTKLEVGWCRRPASRLRPRRRLRRELPIRTTSPACWPFENYLSIGCRRARLPEVPPRRRSPPAP
mmetsp:Transcript_24732/g.71478  ORF Transcript_24732/g.71478 Transcript_24732/m.71478 type:complete len:204 (-) Transcript_24732:269-880(-)